MCPDRPEGPRWCWSRDPQGLGGLGGWGAGEEIPTPSTISFTCHRISRIGSTASHPITTPPLGSATYSSRLLTHSHAVYHARRKNRPSRPPKSVTNQAPAAPTVTCHGTATGTGADTRDPGVVTGPFPACSRLRLKIGPPILLLTFLPSHGECVGGCISMDERWEILGCSASSVIGRPFAACVLIAR